MSRAALLMVMVIGAGGCGGGGDGGRPVDPCLRFTSCGACTPIRGCGWCSHAGDGGFCLSDPLSCPGAQFTWTWEPLACTGSGDAGAAPTDAGPTAGDGGAMCRWPAAASTLVSTDAGASGCLPGTGGNLCASSQYTLTCHGAAGGQPSLPDAALQCTIVPIPTPANVLFYCCPCAS
jgi:hypothetical protein